MPVDKTVYEFSRLFVLNEVGASLWNSLPDAESEEELLHALLEVYEVDGKQAAKDIREFLDKLRAMDVI